jgi:hypothetical protein
MNFAMIRPNPRGRPLWPAAVLGLALAGCVPSPYPSVGADSTAALERALGEALKRQAWSDLRIDTECRTEDGLRSATVFGSGVGVWNRERQITLPREEVLALLQALAASRFARLRETYGEGEEEVQLICRVRLDLDGLSKQVLQLATGPASPELRRLAGRILEAAEEAGRDGPGASSLTDGLEKIARGELAPEQLTLYVLRQSEAPGSTAGWKLALQGGKAILQRDPAPDGEEPRTLRLGAAEIAGLAGQLAAARLEELPVNLWAPEYTDLEIRVLGRQRSLQARQFAGMTPTTHGEQQRRFDRLWEALEAWRGRLPAGQRSS